MKDLREIKKANAIAAAKAPRKPQLRIDFRAERCYQAAALAGRIAPENFGRIEPFQTQAQA